MLIENVIVPEESITKVPETKVPLQVKTEGKTDLQVKIEETFLIVFELSHFILDPRRGT